MRTKYLQIAQILRRQLRQMRQEGKQRLPTEAELCLQYQCSRQTVRKALALLESEGLIDKRRGSGSYLSEGGAAKRVAVVTASDDRYIYPRLLDDIHSELYAAGYEVVNYVTGQSLQNERAILLQLLRERPAGIILERVTSALPSPNIDILEELKRSGICLVSLHAPWGDGNVICVGDDNYGGGYMLASYLMERGHHTIAGIFKSDDMQGVERYRGYFSALQDMGLPIPEQSILWYTTQDLPYILNGAILDEYLLSRLGEATAIVCYNDEIALALIRTLQKHHRAVPEELAVVSFDNSYLCDIAPVSITSLRHERHAVGLSAAKALLTQLSGKTSQSVWLPWTITRRRSG